MTGEFSVSIDNRVSPAKIANIGSKEKLKFKEDISEDEAEDNSLDDGKYF